VTFTPNLLAVHEAAQLGDDTGLTSATLTAMTGLPDESLAAALHEGFHDGVLASCNDRIIALPLTVNA